MYETKFEFSYAVYESSDELPADLNDLLCHARDVTAHAYAPYSGFRVGAVARLATGEIISGSNQENASFPAGLCAERVVLASVASQFPQRAIQTIAISYKSPRQSCDHPIAPCGICRQSLQEYESRMGRPLQLVLGGFTGPVYVIDSVARLLPLAFTEAELR